MSANVKPKKRLQEDLAICPHCGQIFVVMPGGVCPHCAYPLVDVLERGSGPKVPWLAPSRRVRRHTPAESRPV